MDVCQSWDASVCLWRHRSRSTSLLGRLRVPAVGVVQSTHGENFHQTPQNCDEVEWGQFTCSCRQGSPQPIDAQGGSQWRRDGARGGVHPQVNHLHLYLRPSIRGSHVGRDSCSRDGGSSADAVEVDPAHKRTPRHTSGKRTNLCVLAIALAPGLAKLGAAAFKLEERQRWWSCDHALKTNMRLLQPRVSQDRPSPPGPSPRWCEQAECEGVYCTLYVTSRVI